MDEQDMNALEILECARINFENVIKMNPGLKEHPIYQLAIEQLEIGINKVAQED